jgi:4-hydroxybenzoate-CoA ligase
MRNSIDKTDLISNNMNYNSTKLKISSGDASMGIDYNAATELLDRNIDAGHTHKLAFIDATRSITYGQLQKDSRRLANLLKRLGVHREERIALIMLDTVDFPVVFLGAIRAGIVPVPLNTLLLAEQYAYMLSDSRSQILFVSDALLPTVEGILSKLPDLKKVIVVGETAGQHDQLAALLAKESAEFATATTHSDETAFWLYSSGSTGSPKGTRHVQTSLLATADTYGQQVLGIKTDDVCLSAAKFFFAYGLGNALTFPMSVGATTILHPGRPTPADMFRLLEAHQPTIFFGVPTLYAAMLADASLASSKGSKRLRQSVSAGEALPAHVGKSWKDRFNSDILDGVGSTEMLHIFLSNAPGDVVYGTSGRPVPGYEARLVSENDADVKDGDVGEMLVRGSSSADGYWNQREKSRATFQGGWTRTGDKYTRDIAGRYTYCGRADDMFKVSGIWVSPFEVESALITHPAILEAAVVPAEDRDGLTKPKAFVILKAGQSTVDLKAALKEHVKSTVGPWKYPRWIEILEAFPKTATGKIQRFKLRELPHSDN